MRAGARDIHLDLIRLAAIVMVIVVHVSAPLAVEFDGTSGWWWTANLFESFARPGAPLFFMVSGALLLAAERDEAMAAFFSRRLTRVLTPFLVWAAIYLLWRRYYHGEPVSLSSAAVEVISGPVYTHFWFIYVLLGLYLATPVLQVFTRHGSPPQLWWFVTLWFVGSSALPMVERLTGVEVGLGWTVAVGYAGFFLLGYALRDCELARSGRMAAAAGVVVLAGVTAVGTYVVSTPRGALDETFYGNLSPNIVLMSVLLFLLLRSLPMGPSGTARYRRVRDLAGATFGIYLVHPLVQETVHGGWLGVSVTGGAFVPAVAVPVTAALVFALSYALVAGIRRLPAGGMMVP